MFKRKTDYSYYSSYNTKSSKLRLDRVAIAVIAGVVLVIALVVVMNLNRIKLLMKGYSWSETSEVLSLEKDEENEILSHDRMDHIVKWIEESNKVTLYDEYEKFWSYNKKMEYVDIVEYVDSVFNNQVPKLKSMGYSDKVLWSLIGDGADQDDLQYLIDNKLTANDTKPFRAITGYKIQNTVAYIAKYQEVADYNYAVNIVNYPFILSTNQVSTKYTITNPSDLLALVKTGFYLPSDYEPSDLVTPNVSIAPDCQNSTLRKVTAKALEKMVAAAEKEDLHIVLNSGYRSYEEQSNIYKQFETKYGGKYAAEYVAAPGASEHQTGLGIDLTAQSVVEGKRLVFGDTDEYDWVVDHCAEYGFIIRFEEGTADKTGIAHEPWHVRYVGKKVAQTIKEKGWTFEEYCLYENVIPAVTKK